MVSFSACGEQDAKEIAFAPGATEEFARQGDDWNKTF
jgi:hypothetical protein